MRRTTKRDRERTARSRRQKPDRANLATIRAIPLSALTPGVIAWGRVPFTEMDDSKTRPCLVVSRTGREVTVAGIFSSEAARRHILAIPVEDAIHPSINRRSVILARPLVVDPMDLYQIIGEAPPELLDAVTSLINGATP